MSRYALAIMMIIVVFSLVSYPRSIDSQATTLPYHSPTNEYQLTQTLTPKPPPEHIDRIDNLNRLISDENCLVPCWMDLQVGEDNIADVYRWASESLGHRLGARDDEAYVRLGGVLTSLGVGEEIEGSIYMWIHKDLNQLVAVGMDLERPWLSYIDWSPYMLSSILGSYGEPDQMTFEIGAARYSSPALHLRYLDRGFFLTYYFEINQDFDEFFNDTVIVCNDVESTFWTRVWIQRGDTGLSPLMKREFWNSPSIPSDFEVSVEEVTGLDNKEFTEFFATEEQCIDAAPLKEWYEILEINY